MPRNYRRRNYRNRRRRTPWYRRKYDAMSLAAKAAKGVWYLKGLVNSEMLHVDSTALIAGSQNSITHITGIGQGDTDTGRTGNSLLLRNIYIRGRLVINSLITTSSRVMMALVCDTQQIGDSFPSVTDIFKSGTDTETFLNLNASGRFKIMWRKQVVLTTASGGSPTREVVKYIKLRKHVRYNGPNAGDIQKNGIYLVIITSESVNFPAVDLGVRIGYHDN